jgi:hypothetical protein
MVFQRKFWLVSKTDSKHESGIHCDELVSLPKSMLTDYVGSLSVMKLNDLKLAMKIALDIGNV